VAPWYSGLTSIDLLLLGYIPLYIIILYIHTAMRSTVLALASAALLSSTSLGFKQTSPLLVWSSEPWVKRVLSLRNRLRGSNAALTDAAEEINSGVIGADEVYGTVHGLGCDWETLMIVNVEGVSLASHFSRSLRLRRHESTTDKQLTYSYTTLTSHLDHCPTHRKRIYPSHTSCVRLKNPSIAQSTHGHNSAVQR
jgi:hypothetical protein